MMPLLLGTGACTAARRAYADSIAGVRRSQLRTPELMMPADVPDRLEYRHAAAALCSSATVSSVHIRKYFH
jgi:hypothetical protein